MRKHGVQRLYVAGADTALCVDSTARGAVDRGYRVVLVEDACIGRDPAAHKASMRSLAAGTAQIARTAQVLAIRSRSRPNLKKKR